MGKGANGEFAGRNLLKKRKKYRWSDPKYVKRALKLKEKYDPLGNAPMASGIVLQKVVVEQRQPHSGLIKAVKVQLKKNGKVITAHAPRDKAITFIKEHDEVLVAGIGGSQGGPIGSIPGIKYKITAVAGLDLQMLRKGKVKR